MSKRARIFLGRIIMVFLPLQVFPGITRLVLKFMGHKIGRGTVIYSSAEILGIVQFSIGDNSFIGHQVKIMGGQSEVSVGKNCDISSSVSLITGTHKIGPSSRRAGEGLSLDITIGDGVWIGYGSTILGGVEIGDGVIVAAGSLVTKSFPANCLIGGTPARIIKTLAV